MKEPVIICTLGEPTAKDQEVIAQWVEHCRKRAAKKRELNPPKNEEK